MTMPIGHIPCTIAHTQVRGINHHRTRASSRVRSHAPATTATRRKLSTCGRMPRAWELTNRPIAVRPTDASGPTQRRATK
jgi:hypothetical protein